MPGLGGAIGPAGPLGVLGVVGDAAAGAAPAADWPAGALVGGVLVGAAEATAVGGAAAFEDAMSLSPHPANKTITPGSPSHHLEKLLLDMAGPQQKE
ncbi:MAG TPA: hypothetical protein VHC22_31210 [Pirellulales bacterium]|nr:hypothetical protein [Pirellulales bacterium]